MKRKNLLPVFFDFTEGDEKRRASLFEKSETISKVDIFIEDKRKGKTKKWSFFVFS